MFGKTLYTTLLLVSLGFASTVHAADDPTMHQIYAAAEAGQFADAQRMIDKVLLDHPNSGKAHFVESELLAKQGRVTEASAELNKAEALAPGLPFAKPESVQRLKQLLEVTQNVRPVRSFVTQAPTNVGDGTPWLTLLLGGGLVAAVIYGLRALFSRRSAPAYMPGIATTAGGNGYGAPQAGPLPSTGGGGLGSSIVGGLATGAAVGAGMVAGEALVHHFLDGNRHEGQPYQPPVDNGFVPRDDMGGSDFGINDSSTWDESSTGGSDDNW